jgi:hypothetical protein
MALEVAFADESSTAYLAIFAKEIVLDDIFANVVGNLE